MLAIAGDTKSCKIVWLAGGKTFPPPLAQRLGAAIAAEQQSDDFAGLRRRYLGR